MENKTCPQCGGIVQGSNQTCQFCGSAMSPALQNGQDSTSAQTNGNNDAPALWNPEAAAMWGVLFHPLFSIIIHLFNWRVLKQGSVQSQPTAIWLGACIIFIILQSFFGFPWPTYLIFLLVWYFADAKKQVKYVEEKYGKNYKRKSWAIPIISAIAINAIIIIYG